MKRHTWSWLRLLILFVMSALTLSLVLGAVLVGVTVVVAGYEPPQVTADWPGHSGQTFLANLHRCAMCSTHMQENRSSSAANH